MHASMRLETRVVVRRNRYRAAPLALRSTHSARSWSCALCETRYFRSDGSVSRFGWAGAWPCAPHVGDVPAVVQGHLAADGEQLVDLGASALHARLHAGHGEADDFGGLDLRELAEIGEHERLAVRLGELADQRREAAGEFLAGAIRVRIRVALAVRVDGGDEVVGFRGRLPGARAPAVVIDDRVARDAVGERVEPVLDSQLADAAVKAQQHLLRDVLGGVRVADSPADEALQALVEISPEHVRWRVGCGH